MQRRARCFILGYKATQKAILFIHKDNDSSRMGCTLGAHDLYGYRSRTNLLGFWGAWVPGIEGLGAGL